MKLAHSTPRDSRPRHRLSTIGVAAAIALILVLPGSRAASAEKESPRPNVIVIFADDND
jgi:uncharacterized protein (DUF1501 family)